MKRFHILILSFALLLGMTSCAGPDMNIPGGPLTTVEWAETTFDFGKVSDKEPVKHKFIFKNTGTHPLKIGTVKPSCSCTAKDYTKSEVAPGEEGYVELSFQTKGKSGLENKSATVSMNTQPPIHDLKFVAEVVPEESK